MIKKNIIPLFLGLITAIGAAFLNYYTQEILHFSLFTFSLWFVIPVGAICFGALAVSGYYAGAFWLNKSVNKYDFILMISLSALSMYLIYYTEYYFYIVKGDF